MKTIGSINERGYLQGFDRRGYTPAKCLLELVANSLDSIDRKGKNNGGIRFDIGISEIRMSDRNSEGMDMAAITNMFDLHRENNASAQTRGVSGIGAKPALSILSEKRNMHLFTHKGDEYLRVDIPWATIHAQGQYTGMVEVRPMTPAEAATFGSGSGTTIVFPYSDALKDLIHSNFLPIEDENSPLDRIGVVFGREKVRIEYKHFEETEVRPLPMYNYFPENRSDSDYYTGVSCETVEHYWSETGGDRFICNGMEIQRAGRGWAKEPSAVTKNLTGFKRVGEYTVLVGLRRDPAVFDAANPSLPTGDMTNRVNAYNTEHLGKHNREFLCKTKLVRNGQTIGLIPLVDKSIASARGGGDSYVKIQLVQAEVRFNPVSSQNNRQDNAMGIQENKNQFDGDSLPLNFTRLVTYIRWEKGSAIWKHFKDVEANANAETVTDSEIGPWTTPEPVSVAEMLVSGAQVEADDADADMHSIVDQAEPGPVPEPRPVPGPEPVPEPVPVSSPESNGSNGSNVASRLASLLESIDRSAVYGAEVFQRLAELEYLLTA
jgi:hypothetical protein